MHTVAHTTITAAILLLPGCYRASDLTKPPPSPRPRLGWKICDQWVPPVPHVHEAIFDLHVNGVEEPTPESLERIRSAGGVIMHEYHVGQVRALLPVAAAPTLPYDLFQVPAVAALMVDLLIGFQSPFSAADREFLESRGARILQVHDHTNISIVRAIVADAVIPEIRVTIRSRT